MAVVISLTARATERDQLLDLLGVFHALGDGAESQAGGERHQRCGTRSGGIGAVEAHRAHLVALAALHEIGLEVELAGIGPDPRAQPVVGGRHEVARHAQRGSHLRGGIGQGGSVAHEAGAAHVGGQVRITNAEPGLLAVSLELRHGGERVPGHAPALLAVRDAGQGVHDRVEVRADEQAVVLGVVRHVDDHRQVAGREDQLKSVRQLGAAGSAGKERDLHGERVSRSPGAAVVSLPFRL